MFSDPLPGMVRRTKESVKRAADVFTDEKHLTLKLHVSNPIIPRLYVQHKLHKPGHNVRPITPNNNAPTEELAIWLLKTFNGMPRKFKSSPIRNSIDFVNNIKDLEIVDNEIQASFDVEALFPSVPIDTTLSYLSDWLAENNIHPNKIKELVYLTKICMHENWFQFNGKYYKQNHGCCMGSPLSPFIVDLFISYFESELKKQGNFPRIWYRYVDDIWVIIKKHSLRQFINRLNNTKHKTIKFTHEGS